jgi:ADP-ribose pyrophosphatase YjhB (NUDIX family)
MSARENLREQAGLQRTLLELGDEIRAIAKTGLHYTEGHFDRERYEKLVELAARVAASASLQTPEALAELYRSGDAGYITPKLDARMAVFRGDAVLLVLERSDQRWAMPGGFVDVGDTPSEAAVREMFEEAGAVVRAKRLAGVFDYRLEPLAPPALFHIHKLVFLGELLDPDAPLEPGPEIERVAFHPLAALPELSLGRTLRRHIDAAHRLYVDPSAPATFD